MFTKSAGLKHGDEDLRAYDAHLQRALASRLINFNALSYRGASIISPKLLSSTPSRNVRLHVDREVVRLMTIAVKVR